MSTGRFTFLLGTYTTMFGVHIVMALYYSVSWLFRRVSHTFMNYITYSNPIIPSGQGTSKWPGFPQVPPSALTFLFGEDPWMSQALHDYTWHCLLRWWTLPKSHLWTRTIYCWLPGAVSPRLYCSRLVCKVMKNDLSAMKIRAHHSYFLDVLRRRGISMVIVAFTVLVPTLTC